MDGLLRKFYGAYYYASNMALVLLGGYGLDDLQNMAVRHFSDVPPRPKCEPPHDLGGDPVPPAVPVSDSDSETDSSPSSSNFLPPFCPARSLRRLYRIVPVDNRHVITIIYPLPPQYPHWRSKPTNVLAHLLGHEAAGSILAHLKARGLATGCSVEGDDATSSTHSLFTVSFTLSENGVLRWTECVDAVYLYLGMLRSHFETEGTLPLRIYEELREVSEMSYKFAEETHAGDFVTDLVETIVPKRIAPPQDRLLDAETRMFEWRPDLVKDILENFLSPSNSRVDLMSTVFGRSNDYEEIENDDKKKDNNRDVDDDDDDDDDNSKNMTNNETVLCCSCDDPSAPPPPTAFDLMKAMNVWRDNAGYAPSAMPFTPSQDGAPPPQMEPTFGTKFWCHAIHPDTLVRWEGMREPATRRSKEATEAVERAGLALPPKNNFVPTEFGLRALPPDDDDHPLVSSSLKLCIAVGKKKTWFAATVQRYNSIKNQILLFFEDEDEKWYTLDFNSVEAKSMKLNNGYEGTLNGGKVKFRIVALAMNNAGPIRKYEDDTDDHVEDGTAFLPVPPATPASRLPKKIVNNKVLKLWHLQDRKFHRPSADLRLHITSNRANATPHERACGDLFVVLIRDAMMEVAYMAEVCELFYWLSSSDTGYSLRVSGFDHRLLALATEFLKTFLSFRDREGARDGLPEVVKEGRFEQCREILMRSYSNAGSKSSQRCSNARLRCLRPTIWSDYSKLEVLKKITVESFTDTMTLILEKLSVEGLYHGNCNEADAKNVAKLLEVHFRAKGKGGLKKYPRQVVIKVPESITRHIVTLASKDITDPNTAVEIYFQVGLDDIQHRVMIDLLVDVMSEPFFDQLRTKEQFGYNVSVDVRWTYGIMGISFEVVSSSKSASQITERIDKFIIEFRETLRNMKHETFAEHICGLAQEKLEMHNSMAEETDSLWAEIMDKRYDWEISRNEACALRSIKIQEAIDCYDRWLLGMKGDTKKKEGPKAEAAPTFGKKNCLTVQTVGCNGDGRPSIESADIDSHVDELVDKFHRHANHTTWKTNL